MPIQQQSAGRPALLAMALETRSRAEVAEMMDTTEATVSRLLRGRMAFSEQWLERLVEGCGWRREHNVVINGRKRIPV